MICVGGPLHGVNAKVPDTCEWLGTAGRFDSNGKRGRVYQARYLPHVNARNILTTMRVLVFLELTESEAKERLGNAIALAMAGHGRDENNFVKTKAETLPPGEFEA